jgi:hypothetical protein
MENKALEEKELLTSPTYSVISFRASQLPESFKPLIFSRWLRSLRFGNSLFRKIDSKNYHENYHKFIENLLNKPDCLIKFAVLSDDHDVVLGFSVSREDVLDYVHVHTDYRKHKIGTALIPDGITTFTHITLIAIDIWQTNPKYRHLKFNPFA